ncbi:MAG: hypothetical protein KKF68_02295 [Nanoarchaeota archaeon]|nr:hypothetical protein [Nanoarchaeota archaeon]
MDLMDLVELRSSFKELFSHFVLKVGDLYRFQTLVTLYNVQMREKVCSLDWCLPVQLRNGISEEAMKAIPLFYGIEQKGFHVFYVPTLD